MKGNKITFVCLLITAGLFFSFSFTGKTVHKPFTQTELFYDPESGKTFIGVTVPPNPLSIVESEIKDQANWVSTGTTCDNGDYLCKITFDKELTADGGNDGQLTKQEAIDALWAYYASHSNTLPAHGGCFTVGSGPGTVVCVYRKSTP